MMGYGYYGMGFGGIDISYIILVVVSLGLGLATQAYIKSTYATWSKVPVSSGETGAQVATRMLSDLGASQVGITSVAGHLTDFYDPRDNMLHLSAENQTGGSVASVAVACHEAGHAVQTAKNYLPNKIRTALVPVVNFASNAWMVVLMIGFALNMSGLTSLAIILFTFSVLFQIVTLPVEFNASHRAVDYIANSSGLDATAERGARKVLTAAALTYVAATLTSIMQLVYLLAQNERRS